VQSAKEVVMRVLVVDNERNMLRVLERLLAPHHDVSVAASAEEALTVLARGSSFDAILCDLNMPGLDGVGFAERLSPVDASHVVFTTGDVNADPADVGHPILYKPFSSAELLRSLDSVAPPAA
jgi:CheY-like chemotaxis protein